MFARTINNGKQISLSFVLSLPLSIVSLSHSLFCCVWRSSFLSDLHPLTRSFIRLTSFQSKRYFIVLANWVNYTLKLTVWNTKQHPSSYNVDYGEPKILCTFLSTFVPLAFNGICIKSQPVSIIIYLWLMKSNKF